MMGVTLGIVLVLLGLAIGFIIAWVFGAGTTINLFVGLLLVVAGAIVGFVSEWLIDEAQRKNRELVRQLNERSVAGATTGPASSGDDQPQGLISADTLSEFLHKRDNELQELRDKLATTDAELDTIQAELNAYQRTHPDDLTVIKGIGPVYQWKLRDAGVNSDKQLAAADSAQLRRMLAIKNWQRVDIEGWITQARDWAQQRGKQDV